MINFKIRLILWGGLLAVALLSFFWIGDPALGFIFTVFLCWNVLMYFKNGTVMLAFFHVRKGDADKAKSILQQTPKKKWLSFRSKAYYNFTEGYIALIDQNKQAALDAFEAALKGGLKKKDLAIVYLNVIKLSLQLKQREKAEEYYRIMDEAVKVPKALSNEYEGVKLLLNK